MLLSIKYLAHFSLCPAFQKMMVAPGVADVIASSIIYWQMAIGLFICMKKVDYLLRMS